MGTNMAFYSVMNTGFTSDDLERRMRELWGDGVRSVIAYSESARWLPVFEEELCEGNLASDEELERLNKVFGAPVIAFSIFDSDVLLVSYIDDKKHVHNHVKPNIEDFEDFDAEDYDTDFPDFLLDFCDKGGHEKLRSIWQSEEYVFADDRMYDICELLNIKTLYNDSDSDIPEGYRPVFAD